MALPIGCHEVCRPNRKYPRRVTAKAVGRFARYAREAGELESEICEAVAEEIDCGEPKECNCVSLKTLVNLAMDVIILAVAVRVSRKDALRLARDAIAKAKASSKNPAILEPLENALFYLDLGSDAEAKMDEALQLLLDDLKNSAQYDFQGSEEGGDVVITPD